MILALHYVHSTSADLGSRLHSASQFQLPPTLGAVVLTVQVRRTLPPMRNPELHFWILAWTNHASAIVGI